MKKLLILGAGQYGYVAKETAEAMGVFDKISFLDDNSAIAIGALSEYEKLYGEYNCAFVAIGNPDLRLSLINRLSEYSYEIATLKHPSAVIMPSATMGCGSIVEACAVINSNVHIGYGCIISAGAVINHNAIVSDGCHVDCNAVIAARAVVPSKNKVKYGCVFE